MDNATPIIIEGIHYGNFFTGQFFTEEPDMEFFKAQAKKYGFNEAKYLDAVKKVPIWTHEKLNSYLYFVKGLITILSESGLKRLKEIETRKQIEDSKELHHTILQTAIDGFWMTDMQGRLVDVNEAYCRMSGYSREELLTMSIPDLEAVKQTLLQPTTSIKSRHRVRGVLNPYIVARMGVFLMWKLASSTGPKMAGLLWVSCGTSPNESKLKR